MNQNGFEPQNNSGYPYGQPMFGQSGAYSVPANSYPAGYQNQTGNNMQGYVQSGGYPSANQVQTGGIPNMTGNQYNPYPQRQDTGTNTVNNGYPPQNGYPYQNDFSVSGGYYTQPSSGIPNGGYYAPTAGYSVPGPQPVPITGSFIPQTPYSPGYTSPGYQQPSAGGYQPGYNAYAQMGRNTPNNTQQEIQNRQMPLNGGGYVPQSVPVRRGPFELKDIILIISGLILIVLFVIGLILGNTGPGIAVKASFLLLAAGTTAALWIKPMTAPNKRLCYTIAAASLVIVILFSFAFQSPRTASAGMSTGNSAAAASTVNQNEPSQNNVQSDTVPIGNTSAGSTEQNAAVTAEPSPDNATTERLAAFLTYWGGNRLEEMLSLCAPSWLSKQENPKNELFSLLQNRTPKEFMLENITGTDADSSRQVTLRIKIDRNNGKEPVIYRMTVLMLKENSEWYVDPKSLQTNEVAETTDPNVTPTQAPTPTPYVDANTVLYYNPDGGELYHLDPNCRIINSRYLPLKGHFTYGQINDSPYSELKPCNVCGAPLR